MPVANHPFGNGSILLSRKQPIKVFEFSTFALREVKIYDRYPCCLSNSKSASSSSKATLSIRLQTSSPTYIQHRKNNIRPPSHILNRRGRDLHNQEITDPICRRGDTRSLLSQSQWQNLRRVNPDCSLEADGESPFEQEQHDGTCNTGRVCDRGLELDLIHEGSLCGHDERHDRNHGEQERASADTIDKEPRDEAGDEEPELQEARHESREVGAEAYILKQGA